MSASCSRLVLLAPVLLTSAVGCSSWFQRPPDIQGTSADVRTAPGDYDGYRVFRPKTKWPCNPVAVVVGSGSRRAVDTEPDAPDTSEALERWKTTVLDPLVKREIRSLMGISLRGCARPDTQVTVRLSDWGEVDTAIRVIGRELKRGDWMEGVQIELEEPIYILGLYGPRWRWLASAAGSTLVPEYSLLVDSGELSHGIAWELPFIYPTGTRLQHGSSLSIAYYPEPDRFFGRATYWLGARIGEQPITVSGGLGAFAYNDGLGPRAELRLRLSLGVEWAALFAAGAYEPDLLEGRHLASFSAGIEVPWFFVWTWSAWDPSPLLFDLSAFSAARGQVPQQWWDFSRRSSRLVARSLSAAASW